MKEDWVDHTAGPPPSNLTWAATLAFKIIGSALNVYANAKRLTSGGAKQDPDFWADSIRGWVPPARVSWKHHGTGYPIVRCARVPYIVQSRRIGAGFPATESLDYLLVGYTPVTGAALQGVQAWDTRQGGPSLSRLGKFLVEDLWPAQTGTASSVRDWDVPVAQTVEGFDKAGGPPDVAWPFREHAITPDDSVRITVTNDAAQRRYLLVGYEGGGGW